MSYYGNGEFEFLCKHDREMLKNAHWAITQCDLWDWLKDFEVNKKEGFLFAQTPELKRIKTKMFEQDIAQDHSGASYAFTMQSMDFIAKNGYEEFRRRRENPPAIPEAFP